MPIPVEDRNSERGSSTREQTADYTDGTEFGLSRLRLITPGGWTSVKNCASGRPKIEEAQPT